jgi:hypothetical protein
MPETTPAQQPDLPPPVTEINEAPYLREEDARAKYDARMAALDRADARGDWWRHG